MSDTNRNYRQEVQYLSGIVEEFKDELRAFKKEIRGDLHLMSNQIQKNRLDADNLTEGNSRHGIEPVRDIAEAAMTEAKRANYRLDKITWTVIGAAAGGGLSGGVLFNILQALI